MKKQIILICGLISILTTSVAQNDGCNSCHGSDCTSPWPPPPPPPPPPPSDSGSNHISSYDPNDLSASESACKRGWTRRDQVLEYTIRFENDPRQATAAAQQVKIRLRIPAKADVNTFELGDYGFGRYYNRVDGKRTQLRTTLDVRAGIGGVKVRATMGLDTTLQYAEWTFESLDAVTGLPPTDPFAGFLPVNDTVTHEGEGFVVFRYTPKSNSQTFDTLAAQAEIIFDDNPAILTPIVRHIVDADPPQSRVREVRQGQGDSLRVSWSGSDVGCGLKSYNIFLAEDGQSYRPLWVGVSDTIGYYLSSGCKTYQFISLARDSVGNLEPTPNQPDLVFTRLPTDTIRQTTCDARAIGTFRDTIRRVGFCDSVLIKIIALGGEPALTRLQLVTCHRDSVRTDTLRYVRAGCDSLVIRTFRYMPGDTIQAIATTCQRDSVGIFHLQFTNQHGCDSLVLKIVILSPSDTVRLNRTTCIASQVRVDTQRLQGRFCDSIVIRKTTLTPSDTTRLTAFSCTADSAGIFTTLLQNRVGCDSVIIKTVIHRPAAKPTITRSNDTLIASLAVDYQWYRNDTMLLSGSNRFYKATISGIYKVEITDLNGCKMKSDTFRVTLNAPIYNCPSLQKNIGDLCNDGNPNTENDKIQSDCTCNGTQISQNTLTIRCPDNIEVAIPQGATYTNVTWNEPIANSSCNISGGNTCATNTLSGFTFVGELNGHQYFKSNILANWRDAKQLCINNGGYLATISSQAENDFLKSKLQEMAFIGLNDEQNEGHFQWANGEISTFTNWATGQPSQSPQALSEDFVVFQNWDGKWEDVNGLVAKRVLLERDCGNNATPPPTVQQIAGNLNGSVFQLGTTAIRYEAKDACNHVKTCDFTVTVKQTPPSNNTHYCVSKGNTPWQAWIGRVQFKQINQQSSKEGYGNFKGTIATVNTNEIIPISVMPTFSYIQHNGFVRVWIDFNGDNDFEDAGEMVVNQPYQGRTPDKAILPITANVTIPATAKLGTTVMRVSFRQDIAPTPCDVWSNSYGEVEDYSVTIGSNFQAFVAMGTLNAQLIEDRSRLDWVRRSDSISYFEVEKSATGDNFEFLQKIHRNAQDAYHQIFDRNLLEGDNFYRLKIVLHNGQVIYTPNQQVFYEKLLDFTVFPNPANDAAWIDLKLFENRSVEILMTDVAGQVLFTEKIATVGRVPHRLELLDIKSGAYLLTIRTKGKRDIVRKLSILK